MDGTDSSIRHCPSFASAEACNAEIRDLYGSVFKQHNILRFNISVNNSLVMSMLKRAKYLRGEMHRLSPRDNSLLLNILFERYSLDILHNNILKLVSVADIINLNDVRMRKHSNCL